MHCQGVFKNTGPAVVVWIEGLKGNCGGKCHERCCRSVVKGRRIAWENVLKPKFGVVRLEDRARHDSGAVCFGPLCPIGAYSVVLRGTDPKGGSFKFAQKEPKF